MRPIQSSHQRRAGRCCHQIEHTEHYIFVATEFTRQRERQFKRHTNGGKILIR